MSAQPPPPPPPPPPPSGPPTGGYPPPGPSELPLDPPGTAPRQLSPLSMIASIDPRSLIFGVVIILSGGPVALAIAMLVVIAIVAVQVASWYRFRYGFDGAVVRVEEGVLQRRTRSIDVGRIQQVEVDQPLVHRLLGLAVLRLETASEGGDTEVELDGLETAEANRLRDALRPAAVAATAVPGASLPPPTPSRTILQVPLSHLALSAVTGVQLLALPAALLVFGEVLGDVGVSDTVGDEILGLARGAGLVLLVLLLGIGAFVAAVVTAVLRDGGYQVTRRGDDLVVRRGLLTTRETVLPRHRVQVVDVRQNWLRRPIGMASVHVRSAGGGAARDQARRIQVPLVRVGPDLDGLLDHLLPARPEPDDLRPHPPAARRRAMVRSSLRLLGLTGGLVGLAVAMRTTGLARAIPWQLPLVLGAALLLVVGPVAGAVAYRHLAHALGHDVLSSRHGLFGITTSHAPIHRLQGVTGRDSPFQRRLGLATVAGHLAGAGTVTTIVVHDVAVTTAASLRRDLTVAAAGLDPVGS